MRASSYLVALLLAGLLSCRPATAQSLPLYLQANGVPVADMNTTAPAGGALGNFDPARNADPGLTIKRGGNGPGETDPAKIQTWLAPVGAMTFSGTVRLVFWSAVKNYSYGKRGYVTAYLQDCDAAAAACSTIAYGSMFDGFWSDGGSGWVEGHINFGAVNASIGAGRRLAMKLIVSGKSEDDMWFAYATSAYPSRLESLPDPGPGQCTVAPPTQYAAYGARTLAFEGRPKVNGVDALPYPCSVCNALQSTAALVSATATLPTVDAFQASSSAAVQTLTGTIAPGDYGTLKADGATFSGGVYRIGTLLVKGTPRFNAGTYYIDRLLGEKDDNIDALGDQQIKFTVASGPVRIIIGTLLGTRDSGSEMNRGGAAGDLHILLAPGASLMARDNVKMSGFVYAPYSTNSISVGNGLEITGAILTNGTLSTGTGAKFTFGAAEQAALANLRPCTVPSGFTVEQAGGGPIGSQLVGQPFNVRITARDALGNVLVGYNGTVDLSSTGTLSSGITTAAFVNGVLASHAVTISNTGTFTLTATQTGGAVSGTSNAFAVVAPSSRFNAFEPTTAAGSLTGVISTKIGGQPFTLDIIAINSAGTGLSVSAISPVTVELLDASDNSGALASASGCRASWTPIATVTSSFSFAAADNGRKALAMTYAGAAREVRVRITSTAFGGLAGCSTDAFAIRPASFVALQATDSTDTTIGVARLLANSSATAGAVHRAGRAFTVFASAVLADGTQAAGYSAATPQLAVAACLQPAGCSAGALSSSLSASGGAVSGTATYQEAGVVSVVLSDSSFAAIDTADSSPAERTISSAAATFGRFVPDSYRLSSSTPQFAAPLCAAGPARQSFTYVGQPFSFGTAPVVLATPLNASGATLVNARPRFAAAHVAHALAAAGAPVALSATTGIAAIAHGATSLISFDAGSFSFARAATPVASFTPALTMTVNVLDATENGTAGNSTIAAASLTIGPIEFAAAADSFHYGRVQLRPTYGDVRRELVLPLEVQRYNGLAWVALPQAGACLSAPATSFAYSNATALLTSGAGLPNCASRVAGAVLTSNGRAAIRLDKPGDVTSSTPSAMTATLNFLAGAAGTSCSGSTPVAATTVNAPWLANPDGTNPSARLTWGRLRGELIGLRERFD